MAQTNTQTVVRKLSTTRNVTRINPFIFCDETFVIPTPEFPDHKEYVLSDVQIDGVIYGLDSSDGLCGPYHMIPEETYAVSEQSGSVVGCKLSDLPIRPDLWGTIKYLQWYQSDIDRHVSSSTNGYSFFPKGQTNICITFNFKLKSPAQVSVNFNTSNTLVSRLNKTTLQAGSDAEFYFCAKVGYELPKTISISGCSDFRWDRFWGRLEVTNITGNLTGSINSTAIPYNYEQGSALHNLSIGSTQVSNCFIGNSKVNKMYIGTNLVWDSSPSGLMTSLVPFNSTGKIYNHFTVDTGKTAIQIQTILKPLFQKYGSTFLICANATGNTGIGIMGESSGLVFNIMKLDGGTETTIAEVSNGNITWHSGFTSNMIQTANFATSFVSSITSTAPVITIEEAQKVANFIGVDINPEPVTLIQNRSNINNLGVAGFSNEGAPDSVDTYIIADNLKLYRLAWGAEPHTTLKQRPYLTAVDNYDTQLLGWENKGNRYYLQDEIVTIEGKKYSAWRKYNYADTVMEREPELVNPHNAAFDYPYGVSSVQILLYTNPAKF